MTDIYRALNSGHLNVPKEGVVDGVTLPFLFIADDTFPLREDLLKPFNSKISDKRRNIYNYRLSRGRRMVESVFGILAERFGVSQKPMSFINLDKVESVVCCYLHNYFRNKIPQGFFFLLTCWTMKIWKQVHLLQDLEWIRTKICHLDLIRQKVIKQKLLGKGS